jgi:DNA helicase INO80
MPDLFTSLTDFTEWFSKGIEGVAGQGDSTLGTQQLRRLHDVLRPFMLRRIKKNVQSELGDKIEKDILVELSSRQKAMYRMLRSDVSIKAFLAQASAGSDSAAKTNVLLNIVMQFRKVCNHPDLFQRPDVVSPLSFSTFSGSGELIREKELYCPDSCRNPIEFSLPKLVWEDGGILSRPGEQSAAGFDTKYLQNLFNIWSPANAPLPTAGWRSKERSIFQAPEEEKLPSYYRFFQVKPRRPLSVDVIHETSWLTRKESRFVVDDAVAPPVHVTCASRSFIVERERQRVSEKDRMLLFGLPGHLADDYKALERARREVPNLPPLGLVGESPTQQLPLPSMAFPNAKRLMVDSAKLSRMDLLLRELKEGGHRVLVYFQMTKMMDLFEEFLSYRQYRYVRLDGSTQLGERRDMVNAFQTK